MDEKGMPPPYQQPQTEMTTVIATGDKPAVLYGAVFGLGICHIILGVIVFCLQIPITPGLLGIACTGFWCGVMFIVTGSLGVAAWKRRNRGLYTGFLAMCVVSSICALGLAMVAIIDIMIGGLTAGRDLNYKVHRDINLALMSVAFVESILAVVSAGIACCGLCVCCGFIPKQTQSFQYVNTPERPQLVPAEQVLVTQQ